MSLKNCAARVMISLAGASLPLIVGVGPAMAAPVESVPAPSACPSGAAGIFLAHFNSQHLDQTLFGAGSLTGDPSGWLAAHQALFGSMATKAVGAC